jgi:type I restriction enzyme S subunit
MARAMKNSGYDWIGQVPDSWLVLPAQRGFTEIKRKNTDGSVQKALQFKFGTIIPKTNFDADSDDYVADTITAYTIVEPGTVMINGLNLNYDFKTQRSALVKETGVITSAYLALWPDTDMIIPEFATYLFKGYETKMALHNMGSGIRLTLGWKEFKKQPVLYPSLAEQQQIVSFLDHRCDEINTVIVDTQRTIEKYRKLKQTIITEAVTKGVRVDRKMKTVEIELVDVIPDDWSYSPIKYVAAFQPSCETSALNEDSEITYTPMDCIKNGYYIQNTAKYGAVTSSLTPYAEGDIVMAKVTPCFENGNIAIMENLASGFGMGSSELFVYRATGVNKRFLLYWLQNDKFKDEACATMTGAGGLKRVSPYYAKNAIILLPPDEEQAEIVAFLDEKCTEVDRLIAAKEQLLAELESYKKSVIFEYVTGKKEVPACQ